MFIVADIGGTKTRIAASAALESFDAPVIIDTPQDYSEGVRAFVQAAREAAKGEPIEAVSVGLPGSFARGRSLLYKARNLSAWSGKNVGADMGEALGCPVSAENDVALVGLGEAHFGAATGAHIAVYMTVSTGVNAVRIVGGVIDEAVHGFETGGQYLFNDGRFVEFEDLISGHAIEKKYGKHPKELGLGHPVWEELAEVTALGLYNTILHWSPERVVLGGSMFNEIGIPVESVGTHLAKLNKKYPDMPEVVHSGLGDLGGLWGGIARLKQDRS